MLLMYAQIAPPLFADRNFVRIYCEMSAQVALPLSGGGISLELSLTVNLIDGTTGQQSRQNRITIQIILFETQAT